MRPDQGPHARREPREHLTVPVWCRLLDVADSRSRKTVFGETKNLSNGGARVSLSEPFPLMSRVEVSLWIGGLKLSMPRRTRRTKAIGTACDGWT
jgi:hypothetical protein